MPTLDAPRSADARAWLGEADDALASARAALDATPPALPAALDAALASCRASLVAHLTAYGAEPEPDADLDALGKRVVRIDSVIKTSVHRALHLAGRAGAIRAAALPSVHDRETVATGWYTARNLRQAVGATIA